MQAPREIARPAIVAAPAHDALLAGELPDDEDEEESEPSVLPRGLKRWVVTEAFVRRHSEAEFAGMLRRVKWVW